MSIRSTRVDSTLQRFVGGGMRIAASCSRAMAIILSASVIGAGTPMAIAHTAGPAQDRAPVILGSSADGARIAKDHCAACHGIDGNSPKAQDPKLAGQNAAYLYAQLGAYKTGARKSDVMTAAVAPLYDSQLAEVANFYAAQPVRSDPVENPARAATGREIFLSGTGLGMEPPCVMCHSSSGAMPMVIGKMTMNSGLGRRQMHSIVAEVPKLAGQHAKYVVEQLNRYADGRRPSIVMAHIAASMSANDRKAVAAYLSSLH